MRIINVALLITCTCGSVTGAEISPITEQEALDSLMGCWAEMDENYAYYEYVCFKGDGKLNTGWYGPEEGMITAGRYAVRDDRLYLSIDELDDVWGWKNTQLSCSVTFSEKRMAIHDCSDGTANAAYERVSARLDNEFKDRVIAHYARQRVLHGK